MPDLFVIAGPNGSGKTTFAKRFLPEKAKSIRFLNTDLIASGLSPFAPALTQIQAGRLMIEQVREAFKRRESFCLETTLSGKTYLPLFRKMKNAGYEIHIIFLWVADMKMTVNRIKERVNLGGHDVARKDIYRRFKKGICNLFHIYLPVIKDGVIYDNQGLLPVVIAEMENNQIQILNRKEFNKIQKITGLKYE